MFEKARGIWLSSPLWICRSSKGCDRYETAKRAAEINSGITKMRKRRNGACCSGFFIRKVHLLAEDFQLSRRMLNLYRFINVCVDIFRIVFAASLHTASRSLTVLHTVDIELYFVKLSPSLNSSISNIISNIYFFYF